MASPELAPATLRRALETLGELLEQQGTTYEFVVIGGASLSLRGMILRSTADIDVLGTLAHDRVELVSPLPQEVLLAADRVAAALGLSEGWFGDDRTRGILERENPLPPGMEQRLERFTFGSRLVLHLAARQDVVALKIDAALTIGDRSMSTKHHDDLRFLAPTQADVDAATQWIESHLPAGDVQHRELAALVEWLAEVGS